MPIYDVHCLSCDRRWERLSTIAARREPCECGGGVELEFTHSVQSTAFAEYFDHGLGETVSSLGQRHALMRKHGLQYRDKMSPGDMSARRDRIEQQKREAGG